VSVSQLGKEVFCLIDSLTERAFTDPVAPFDEDANGYRVEFSSWEGHWSGFGPSESCPGSWEKGVGGAFVYEAEARFFTERRSEHVSVAYRIVSRYGVVAAYRYGCEVEPERSVPDTHEYNVECDFYLDDFLDPIQPTTRRANMAEIDLHIEGGDTLEYNRTDVVARLRERLAANIAKRQAEKDKLAEKNKESYDRIVAALDNPNFLIWLVATIKGRAAGFDPTSDTFGPKVAETWPDTDGDDLPEERDPDFNLRRLIDVYDLATNDTIKLTIGDDAWAYMARPRDAAAPEGGAATDSE